MSANSNITDNRVPVAHDVRMGIARLRKEMGLKGLGIYFLVSDALDNCGGRLDRDYETLAYMLSVKDKDLRHVVEDFGLFIIREVYGSECILMPGAKSSDMNRTHAANARPNVRPEADYVTGRVEVSYRTEDEMKKHFANWVRKGCVTKAIDKAREAERQRAGRERYEREQKEAHRERLRRAETAVTYAEYCRLKGVETTGDLIADIHRRLP